MSFSELNKEEIKEKIREVSDYVKSRSMGRTKIIAVTKSLDKEAIVIAKEAGIQAVGENYAQELIEKHQTLGDLEIEWHMIGAVQRNKIRKLSGILSLWQSVDRIEVLEEIKKRDPAGKVLIQINPLGETGKGGCSFHEARGLIEHGLEIGLSVEGVMAVGVQGDLGKTSDIFSKVEALTDEFGLPERSIGMSDDIEVAIDHGSTMLRIGRALFGERTPKNK